MVDIPKMGMNTEKYQSHISKSLTAGTEGMKKGSVAFMGKVFENLKNKMTTTIHQIQTLMTKGKLINDKKAISKLNQKIENFNKYVNNSENSKVLNQQERDSILDGVSQMRIVCTAL
jgi:hypothetical protein